MAKNLNLLPLSMPWQTLDPFLFCVYHLDTYPKGNQDMGPDASLEGRHIGQDFEGVDGWRMYHGSKIPGFPQHPHRGFETITIVRQGLVDHSDSLGATARFGHGDIQWLTAGKGINHSEMFPLVKEDSDNPLELFQIWLNLPRKNKFAEPYFSMYWSENINRKIIVDDQNRESEILVYVGNYQDAAGVSPPPESWASEKNADIAIFTIQMSKEAKVTLPATNDGVNRAIYFFEGDSLLIDRQSVTKNNRIEILSSEKIELQAGALECEILLLQGRPIGEPVAQYGPFVMNTQAEIQQAMADYQNTQFGGWPWSTPDPVHDRDQKRFAKTVEGKVIEP